MAELIKMCPSCGSGDVHWCGISVRPYCAECGTWAPVNFGTAEEAIEAWNRKVKKAFPEIFKIRPRSSAG